MTVRTRTKARIEQERLEWQARQRRRQMLIVAAWVAAGLALVALIGYLVWKEVRPIPQPGEDVPTLGGQHVNPGVPHDPYNSDPPTSGPHYPETAQPGFYNEAPVDELLVHNLEHGNVIIWYNCTGLDDAACTTLKDQVREVMGAAGNSKITGALELIAVPRPAMQPRLALTSWGRIDRLDQFDRKEILEFIAAFRDGPKAPEPFAS